MTTFDVHDPKFLDSIPLKGVGPEHLKDKLILPAHLAAGAFGLVGNIVAIDPDDAASAGSTGLIADAGHSHEWICAAPSALTKTATNSEGSSTDGARADHGHSTAALPWGIVARHILTVDSSGFTAPGTADWLLDEVAVDVTRLYRINLLSAWGITIAGDRALIAVHADGTQVARLGDTDTVGTGSFNVLAASIPWEPATGTPDLDVRITGLAGAGTFTFFAAATFPRVLWVEDIGPR
jgi:hypothetical protein